MEPARCPSTAEKIKKTRSIYTTEFYAGIKKKIIKTDRTGNRCGELSSQIQKDKLPYVFSHKRTIPPISEENKASIEKNWTSPERETLFPASRRGWEVTAGPSPGAWRGRAAGSTVSQI